MGLKNHVFMGVFILKLYNSSGTSCFTLEHKVGNAFAQLSKGICGNEKILVEEYVSMRGDVSLTLADEQPLNMGI